THGNAGYLTFFRNYASSQWSPSKANDPKSAIVWSQPFVPQYALVGSLAFPSPDLKMTAIGNVLGSTADGRLGLPADLGTTRPPPPPHAARPRPAPTPPRPPSQASPPAEGSQRPIFVVDQAPVSWTSLWLHGNFDTVNKSVMWNASAKTANLPPSTQHLPASL